MQRLPAAAEAMAGDEKTPGSKMLPFSIGTVLLAARWGLSLKSMSNPINVANKLTLRARVLLAVMPLLLVMAMLFLLERFGRERILFSSLAASAFLIYLDPRHPTNSVRTLVIAQSSAAIIGLPRIRVDRHRLLGRSHTDGDRSDINDTMQGDASPAVATALVFAFQETKPNALLLFLLSLLLLVFLIGLQRTSIWLIKRGESRTM